MRMRPMRRRHKNNMASLQEGVFIEEENAEKLVGRNDLRKLRDVHFTAGVREGIIAGKESALQDGFNCGYKEAFCQSYNLAQLRGVLCAILSFVTSRTKDKSTQENHVEKINRLLKELTNVEAKQMTELKACLKDRKFKEEKEVTCCNNGDTVVLEEKAKDSLTKSDLRKLWDQCKCLCNDIGIDIQKIKVWTQP